MNRRIHIESSSEKLMIYLRGMQKDQFEKKTEFWRWEGHGQDPDNDQNGATQEMYLKMIGGSW